VSLNDFLFLTFRFCQFDVCVKEFSVSRDLIVVTCVGRLNSQTLSTLLSFSRGLYGWKYCLLVLRNIRAQAIEKPSAAIPALLLIAGVFINPVVAYPADEWFELLIDTICELTAEKGKVVEVESEAVDDVLQEGYATELTTYAMSVGDQGFGEAIANGLLAT